MLFPTITFAVFFAMVLPLSWLLMPRPARWKVFILAASYVFYASWDWRFCGLLAGATLVNWAVGQRIHKTRRAHPGYARVWLGFGVAANLAVLGWFKYYGFFAEGLNRLLDTIGLPATVPMVAMLLPVGISFYLFQAISYIVDLNRGDIEPAKPVDFAVYLSFFPHLVAGPIVRASEFVPQLQSPRDPRRVDLGRGIFLVGAGLFKKVVIAGYLGWAIVDPVYAAPGQASALDAVVGTYAFAAQIYADFSGYTDIAIGVALLLGFKFPQNFEAPYTAVSVRDFWRRWHMTLSRWLRDYLYIPLGGNQGRGLRTSLNLMATMLLGGLWHGAAWNFVLWGGIHGAGLVYEHRADTPIDAGGLRPGHRVWRRFLTFNFVCLAWVFFRAANAGDAFALLGRLFTGWGAPSYVTLTVVVVVLLGIVPQYVLKPSRIELIESWIARVPALPLGLVAAGGLLLVDTVHDVLVDLPIDPFIYFRF